MNKIFIAAASALLVTVATLGASDARACGPYVSSPEDIATLHVYDALTQHKVRRYVSDVDVELFDSRRGEATIGYNHGRKLVVGLTFFRGQWKVTQRAPQRRLASRRASKRAVAAR